jgi:hypothetical protein
MMLLEGEASMVRWPLISLDITVVGKYSCGQVDRPLRLDLNPR